MGMKASVPLESKPQQRNSLRASRAYTFALLSPADRDDRCGQAAWLTPGWSRTADCPA